MTALALLRRHRHPAHVPLLAEAQPTQIAVVLQRVRPDLLVREQVNPPADRQRAARFSLHAQRRLVRQTLSRHADAEERAVVVVSVAPVVRGDGNPGHAVLIAEGAMIFLDQAEGVVAQRQHREQLRIGRIGYVEQ